MTRIILTPRHERVEVPESWPSARLFANWWWRVGCPMDPPAGEYYREHAGSRQIVLFRHGQFQVEQVILLPGFPVPEHRHPNVESMECYVHGDGEAWVGGKRVADHHDGGHPVWSRRLRIGAGVWHSGIANGVTIALSQQQWLGGVTPSFITDDWEQADGGVWV